ncbi:ribonuclease P protein component [Zafaria sp. Z1313]|uniref:ribonuclease P protein component n=1 Tax=unclassified Zafaria TaxID=2828765 RepID=UPI003D301BE7
MDFSTTVRSGARSGRRNVVLYARRLPDGTPSRFGFIVSKAVGNAVARNLVKRRLRAVAAGLLGRGPAAGAPGADGYATGYDVVVRALAPAAGAGWDALRDETVAALATAAAKASRAQDGRDQTERYHTGNPPGKGSDGGT